MPPSGLGEQERKKYATDYLNLFRKRSIDPVEYDIIEYDIIKLINSSDLKDSESYIKDVRDLKILKKMMELKEQGEVGAHNDLHEKALEAITKENEENRLLHITDKQFPTLKENNYESRYWDEDIDAILSESLKKYQDVFQINAYLLDKGNAINVKTRLAEVNHPAKIVLPLNLGGDHWISVVLETGQDLSLKKATILNSIATSNVTQKKIDSFLGEVFNATVSSEVQKEVIEQKNDVVNCGPLSIQNTINYLDQKGAQKTLDKLELKNLRANQYSVLRSIVNRNNIDSYLNEAKEKKKQGENLPALFSESFGMLRNLSSSQDFEKLYKFVQELYEEIKDVEPDVDFELDENYMRNASEFSVSKRALSEFINQGKFKDGDEEFFDALSDQSPVDYLKSCIISAESALMQSGNSSLSENLRSIGGKGLLEISEIDIKDEDNIKKQLSNLRPPQEILMYLKGGKEAITFDLTNEYKVKDVNFFVGKNSKLLETVKKFFRKITGEYVKDIKIHVGDLNQNLEKAGKSLRKKDSNQIESDGQKKIDELSEAFLKSLTLNESQVAVIMGDEANKSVINQMIIKASGGDVKNVNRDKLERNLTCKKIDLVAQIGREGAISLDERDMRKSDHEVKNSYINKASHMKDQVYVKNLASALKFYHEEDSGKKKENKIVEGLKKPLRLFRFSPPAKWNAINTFFIGLASMALLAPPIGMMLGGLCMLYAAKKKVYDGTRLEKWGNDLGEKVFPPVRKNLEQKIDLSSVITENKAQEMKQGTIKKAPGNIMGKEREDKKKEQSIARGA